MLAGLDLQASVFVTVNDKIAAKDKILKAADKSVYDAKNTGKNKVIYFK